MKDKLIDHPKLNPLPDVLSIALSEAKAADDIYGPNSLNSSDAWNKAEQIAMDINISGYSPVGVTTTENHDKDERLRYKETALRSHHEHATVIDTQSLEDVLGAIMKLEHLTRLLAIEKGRLSST
mmetsp:Transcript_18711/g.22936  ORF Transcript_18711/g.22936 Transcript_18711/m.22936 type:complete len:125 (-) Transcript_18711:87-461(-)